MKLFRSACSIALALIVSVSTLAVLFPSNTASAVDPTFKWTGPNTIEASHFSVTGKEDALAIFGGSNGVFVSDPIYRVPVGSGPGDLGGGTCTFKATITVNQGDNSKGTLAVQRTDTLDRNLFQCPLPTGPITISNAQGGGSGVIDYGKVNCADGSQNGGDQSKCDAVKKCINDAHKSLQDCANAWDTCLTTLTNGGAITDANKKKCADLVSAGKTDEAKSVKTDNGTKCAIQAIGWLICPVMNFMAGLVDATYGFVKVLLDVPPLNTDTADTGNGAYIAWSTMRNFGNVGFVITFLVIIFSQVTNIGMSNYGIKKMLPRLIAAAILVNTSYWIGAVAIDLSNIVGSSVNGIFETAAKEIPLPDANKFGATGSGWTGLTGGILAGTAAVGAAIYIGLSALIPVLITVLFLIVGIFLTLTIRQALILGLVVVFPILILGKVLRIPGLQGISDKGFKTFGALLVIYPAIGFLFGGSKLASAVLFTIAGDNIAIKIMAAGVTILPLGLAFFIKQATAAVGGVFGRIAGRLNDPNKGFGDRAKNAAKGFRERQEGRREIRALNGNKLASITSGGKYGRRAKRNAIAANIQAEQKRAQSMYVANQANKNNGDNAFANRLAGGRTFGPNASDDALQRALSRAKFTIEKAEAEEVQAHHAEIDNLDEAGLMDIITNGDREKNATKIAAAMERLVKIGEPGNINAAINRYGTDGKNDIVNKSLAAALAANGPGYLKASDIDNIARGQFGDSSAPAGTDHVAAAVAKNIATGGGVYSPDKLVAANNYELEYVSGIADQMANAGDSRGVDNLQAAAKLARTNATTSAKIKHNGENIEKLDQYGTTS